MRRRPIRGQERDPVTPSPFVAKYAPSPTVAGEIHPAIVRLASLRKLTEDIAADQRMQSQTRMLASALESTIENLLDLIEGATISWPRGAA